MTITRLLEFWASAVRPGQSLVGIPCDVILYARGLAAHIQARN